MTMRKKKKKKKPTASKTQAHIKHTHSGNLETIQQQKTSSSPKKIQNTTKKLIVGLISSDP